MQTLIDGAVIVQGNLEAVGRLESRPGVIPADVKDVWLEGNPFEPLSPYADHKTTDDTWIPRASQKLITNQTYPAKPATAGFGTPDAAPILPDFTPYIPGKA